MKSSPQKAEPFRFTDLVGRWSLRITSTLVAAVVRELSLRVPPSDLAATLDAVLDDALNAKFEVRPNGHFVTESGSVDLFSKGHVPMPSQISELAFEMAPGEHVRLRMVNRNVVLVLHTEKPEMLFDRVVA